MKSQRQVGQDERERASEQELTDESIQDLHSTDVPSVEYCMKKSKSLIQVVVKERGCRSGKDSFPSPANSHSQLDFHHSSSSVSHRTS